MSALVLGGTGAVGGAVLDALARRGVSATFTYLRSEERARQLAAQGHQAARVDLADAGAVLAMLAALPAVPSVFIHCAAHSALSPLGEVTLEAWQRAVAVNGQSAFLCCQWLAQRMAPGGAMVLVGALDRGQSLPLPVPYAATQGMLSALVMALAHEVGPKGLLVNLVALGVLSDGLARSLDPRRRGDYERFSALRRIGTPDEAARVITWLALENRYINGRVIPVNGGV